MFYRLFSGLLWSCTGFKAWLFSQRVPARKLKTGLICSRQLNSCDNTFVVVWVKFCKCQALVFFILYFFLFFFFSNFIMSLFKQKSSFPSRPRTEETNVFDTGHDSTTVLPLHTFSSCFPALFFADLELQQHLLQHFSFGSACHSVFTLIPFSTSLSSYACALSKLMDRKGISINDLFSNCNILKCGEMKLLIHIV